MKAKLAYSSGTDGTFRSLGKPDSCYWSWNDLPWFANRPDGVDIVLSMEDFWSSPDFPVVI
jgi:hypothetical protein